MLSILACVPKEFRILFPCVRSGSLLYANRGHDKGTTSKGARTTGQVGSANDERRAFQKEGRLTQKHGIDSFIKYIYNNN